MLEEVARPWVHVRTNKIDQISAAEEITSFLSIKKDSSVVYTYI